MAMNHQEKNYQRYYCETYFGVGNWEQEVLNNVDVLLKGKRGRNLLYIEFKYIVISNKALRQARAQTILTNKKQENIMSQVALAYKNANGDDVLELIDCSNNEIMYNNDINWKAEIPSSPSVDAVDRINERIHTHGKITFYYNDGIKELYKSLRNGNGTQIAITDRNFNVVYNQWRNSVQFINDIKDEQTFIELYLIDILNGVNYKQRVIKEIAQPTLWGTEKVGTKIIETSKSLVHDGTDLSKYKLRKLDDGEIRIEYSRVYNYVVKGTEAYNDFWNRYKRPPEYDEFIKILEHSSRLYTDKYRKNTGGEYTPICFVKLQNQLLQQYGYNLDDYIVCDPCAGVGNLENQFGRDYKRFCYLSTLEKMDVDVCKIKGFENSICYDYLKDDQQPRWKYGGELMSIKDIAQREGRKLMVIMNPPYTRRKGFKHDLAIEFFLK